MTPTPPLPPDVWVLPVAARILIEAMQIQIAALQAEVWSLKRRFNGNSRGYSQPSSADPIHLERQPSWILSGRKWGGQPGQQRSIRPLVPPEQFADVITCKPAACSGCGHHLDGTDFRPRRHQVAEVTPIRPVVVEHQPHLLACSGCGRTIQAPLPQGVPTGSFDPRLQTMLSPIAADFRLDKRLVRRLVKNFLDLDISLGMVAKLESQTAIILGPVDEELAEAVRSAPASHMDGTTRREDNGKAWLWVGTVEGVTHLQIAPDRKAQTARLIPGDEPEEVVICGRFSVYCWVTTKHWCWAHLRRVFQPMIDRDDGGSRPPKLSDNLFWGWLRVSDGELSWVDFWRWAGPIRAGLCDGLDRAASCSSVSTAATSRHLLGGEGHLWRFLAGDGVEPTNNTTERAVRYRVLWRKSSGGAASEWGGRFVSRLLGVVATYCQQCRSALEFLTSCFEAHHPVAAYPSTHSFLNEPIRLICGGCSVNGFVHSLWPYFQIYIF